MDTKRKKSSRKKARRVDKKFRALESVLLLLGAASLLMWLLDEDRW
jgi:hypothetical protein